MKPFYLCGCALWTGLLISGCGRPPQVAPGNRKLIDGLRTAASSQQLQWIEESEKQIEENKQKGTISEQESAEFASIVKLAKEGKWKEAEAAAIRLGKAQKPTAEEVGRLKARRKPGP